MLAMLAIFVVVARPVEIAPFFGYMATMRRRSFLGFEINPGWPWLVFQCLVAFAVIASNIHWQWATSPAVAGLVAFVAAFLATVVVSGVLVRLAAFRARRGDITGNNASRREPSLLRPSGGTRDALEQPPRIRVGNDPR